MATLTITIDYAAASGFSYTPSYTDATGTYTAAAVADPGTIAFINSGQYTLLDGAGTQNTFTFDSVSVVLESSLSGMSSQKCGCTGTFDLGSIVFPTIPADQSPVATTYSWCQQYPGGFGPAMPHFKDPKLGLSNTTGNSPTPAPAFPRCSCNST